MPKCLTLKYLAAVLTQTLHRKYVTVLVLRLGECWQRSLATENAGEGLLWCNHALVGGVFILTLVRNIVPQVQIPEFSPQQIVTMIFGKLLQIKYMDWRGAHNHLKSNLGYPNVNYLKLLDFSKTRDILADCQHGCRSQRSCETPCSLCTTSSATWMWCV